MDTYSIVLIALYFILVFSIGVYVRRKESMQDFLIGSRKVTLLQTVASMFAVMGGLAMLTSAALGYDYGIGAVWLWIGTAVGMVCLGFASKKIKNMADRHKFLTIGDYFFTLYDKKTGTAAAIVIFVTFLALLIGQFIVLGSIIGPLLGIPHAIAVVLTGAVTLAYLYLGGYKAVIKTDVLQFLFMFFILGLLVLFISPGHVAPEQLQLFSQGVSIPIIFIVMGIFVMFSAADIWQRIFSAENVKTVRNSLFITALLFVVFGVLLAFVGIVAKSAFPDIQATEALYYGMFQLLPQSLVGVALVVILAAIMSSIDTELFLLSSSIAKDFTKGNMKRTIHISLVVLTIIAVAAATYVPDLLTFVFGLVSLALVLAPAIIASLFWKLKSNAVFTSIIVGVLAMIGLFVFDAFSADTSIITLPVSLVTLGISQAIYR